MTKPKLLFAAVLLLAGCQHKSDTPKQTATASPDKPIAVHVATVETEQRPVALLLDGTLLADEQSDVTSVVAGRVREVLVERGSVVKKNDPLVRLRDVDYRLAAQAAQAQLDQARARLGIHGDAAPPNPTELPDVQAARTAMELADRNAERADELDKRGVLTAASLDEAHARESSAHEQYQSALNAARASVSALQAAQVALHQARTSASEATVRAPFTGEIADRKVSVGEYVSPQTPLVSLVRTDPLRIELEVPQRHLLAVQPGQTVELTVDAVPGRTFQGTVRYVSAAVGRSSRALTVEAVVQNPDRLLRPGLFASARLHTGGSEKVCIVPEAALHTAAGVSRVFVVDDGRIHEHVVSIGDQSGGKVVLTSGLEGGEHVAIDELDKLADGVAVTVDSSVAKNGR